MNLSMINNLRLFLKYRTLSHKSSKGFTLVELMISISIVATLASIAIPNYIMYIEKGRVARAIVEIRNIEKEISSYWTHNGHLPDSLEEVKFGNFNDPWGTPYQYLRINGGNANKGKMRKDRFLVPVNSDYDLYSNGKDTESVPPFTAKPSHDDIVRTNDGGYVGLASEY